MNPFKRSLLRRERLPDSTPHESYFEYRLNSGVSEALRVNLDLAYRRASAWVVNLLAVPCAELNSNLQSSRKRIVSQMDSTRCQFKDSDRVIFMFSDRRDV